MNFEDYLGHCPQSLCPRGALWLANDAPRSWLRETSKVLARTMWHQDPPHCVVGNATSAIQKAIAMAYSAWRISEGSFRILVLTPMMEQARRWATDMGVAVESATHRELYPHAEWCHSETEIAAGSGEAERQFLAVDFTRDLRGLRSDLLIVDDACQMHPVADSIFPGSHI